MSTLKMKWVFVAAAVGLAAVAWRYQSAPENVTDSNTNASVSPTPPGTLSEASAVTSPASADALLDTPPGVLLVGTVLEGAQPAAVFMWGGQSITVPVGARIGSSVFTLQRVTGHGAWVTQAGSNAEREIVLRSPKALSEVLARERQAEFASRLPSELASRPRPADPMVVQRAEDGTPLPAEMQAAGRHRERSPTGPVGSP